MSEINGFFVRGGLLQSSDPEVWIYSYVRLDSIKTIHRFRNDLNWCNIYTYKDEWYACAMSPEDLVKEINKIFSISPLKLSPFFVDKAVDKCFK